MNKKSDNVLMDLSPLSPEDCFYVVKRAKPGFYYPLHMHPNFQLNYMENVSGALRIVGDSVEEMDEIDLLLVSAGTKHAYTNHKCLCKGIVEISIQFEPSLFDSFIDKRHFKTIKDMFDKAVNGVVFSREMIHRIRPELQSLSDEPESFPNFLKLIHILKILSMDADARSLNTSESLSKYHRGDTDRLKSIMLYLHENYQDHILLPDLASVMNMSESSITRFLKRWTGKTFIDNLNEIRIAEAVNKLIDTSDSVSEICYKCGFNNLSNFNRIFKKLKGYTPTEYRERYARTKFRI